MSRKLVTVIMAVLLAGCKDDNDRRSGGAGADPVPAVGTALMLRAYVVNALSNDMTVIDLSDPANATVLTTLPTASTPHMAAVSEDGKKVYASGTLGNAVSIFDAKALTLIKHQPVGAEPTHMTASPDNKYVAVCNEGTNEVSFIGVASDAVEAVVPGMLTPHWVAFRPDSKFAYVANINGHRITIIDMATFAITGHIFLSGQSNAMAPSPEGGFAECFLDSMGILYSAHGDSGKVMTVNTTMNAKIGEITVGTDPWVAYVSPFGGAKILVANQGSATVSIIDGNAQTVIATIGSSSLPVKDPDTGATLRMTGAGGEFEVYGINFGYFGQKAYAGFRTNGAVQKINLLANTAEDVYSLTEGLSAAGFTQPAATTPDQRYIVFCVTSKSDWEEPGASGPVNRIVIWDSLTDKPVKVFDNVGVFPWSATIPDGQDYCH